ncbi:MAG: DNA internalization-related competence protein ComEC/Rec2 [Sedimenticola sp.]
MVQGALGFAAGIYLLQLQSELPPLGLSLVAPIPLLLLWRFPGYRLILSLAIGFLWALWIAHGALPGHTLSLIEGEEVVVEGVVDSLPEDNGRRLRFGFRIEQILNVDYSGSLPLRVRLSWYAGYPNIDVGERWRLKVKLKRAHGFSNPGGFDYEGWLYRMGIRATGYVRDWEENRRIDGNGVLHAIDRWRSGLRKRVTDHLGNNPGSAMLVALTIGERGGFERRDWQVFSRTGTNHLVAISGLHIGIVAGLLFFVGNRLWRISVRGMKLMPAHQAAAIFAFTGALVYAALAGFAIPTQRALLMLAVVLAGLLMRRPVAGSRSLLYALVVVLVFDPLAVLSAGFWLSFAAVGAIFLALAGRVGRTGYLQGMVRVQLYITVLLSPLLFLWGMGVSLLAPLINLVAVPLFSFLLVPLSLVTVLLADIYYPAGMLLLDMTGSLLSGVYRLLELLAGTTGFFHPAPAAPPMLWSVALVGVLLMLAPVGMPARLPGVVLVAIPFFWNSSPLSEREVRFTLLDVGQGMSAVLETRHHRLVYDAGPRFSESFDAGSAVLVPYLQHIGVKDIDRVILSNGDLDHAGGYAALAGAFPIRSLLIGDRDPQGCQAGTAWQWDGVRFRILHPDNPSDWHGNNSSCVLLVEAGGHRLLLTGDIEGAGERSLVERYPGQLGVDLVTIPHHGSLTSSGELFVDSVSPRYAIASVGYRNRYGFPRPEVRARWHAAGAEILTTAESGAITFILGRKGGLDGPRRHRMESRRYWHWSP